jgi:CheY-like chemotaxis protein
MSIAGVKVLLVEDEAIIAMMAEDMLEDLGCIVAATASTLSEALAEAEKGGFDVALLDINLNGFESLPVAARLRERGCPFIFTTGYGSAGRGSEHGDVPLLTKPYRPNDLGQAIVRALGRD